MSKKLVIVPTYNEIENVADIVSAVLSLPQQFHLLIVDDSSPDGTGELVAELQKNFPNRLFLEVRKQKNGLGRAYIHGFKWAIEREYDFIFEMDADFSHNPNDLPRLLEACENGADLAVGSRYCKGVNVVNWPMQRVLLSFFASKFVKFVTGMPLHDSTAGFVCFRRRVLQALPLDKIKMVGYGFQIEMKFRTWKRKFKIEEVPIIFTDRSRGESKMHAGIIHEAVWGVFAMKWRSFFGKF